MIIDNDKSVLPFVMTFQQQIQTNHCKMHSRIELAKFFEVSSSGTCIHALKHIETEFQIEQDSDDGIHGDAIGDLVETENIFTQISKYQED